MSTSGSTSTYRLLQIDDSNRSDHYYLSDDDSCRYFGEYHSRAGYGASAVNNLISNFKKPVDRRGRPEYRYKDDAIRKIADLIAGVVTNEIRETVTFVPVPPSKVRGEPLYDDRLVQALRAVVPAIDVRELLVRVASGRPHHEYAAGETRPRPQELQAMLRIDEKLLMPPLRQHIVVFDDLLTTGCHFKACQAVLTERVPDRSVTGLFVARNKRPDAFAAFRDLDDATT